MPTRKPVLVEVGTMGAPPVAAPSPEVVNDNFLEIDGTFDWALEIDASSGFRLKID